MDKSDQLRVNPQDIADAYVMPDVSVQTQAQAQAHLDRVGMRKIEIPVQVKNKGIVMVLPAKIDAFVSLDRADARGIHMSRLYRGSRDFFGARVLDFHALEELLKLFLESHSDLSGEALVRVSFQLPVQRQALKSEEMGWRYYPIWFESLMSEGKVRNRFGFEVLYSSTCPCSAALARQLMQDRFMQDFDKSQTLTKSDMFNWLGHEQSVAGVAHAQRSRATVSLELNDFPESPLELIDLMENALGTPVQAAVKREDEQEFGRLNAENLMFCEDAGRRLKTTLDQISFVTDYRVEVCHEESLHPHDAVAVAVKGVANGFRPDSF